MDDDDNDNVDDDDNFNEDDNDNEDDDHDDNLGRSLAPLSQGEQFIFLSIVVTLSLIIKGAVVLFLVDEGSIGQEQINTHHSCTRFKSNEGGVCTPSERLMVPARVPPPPQVCVKIGWGSISGSVVKGALQVATHPASLAWGVTCLTLITRDGVLLY